MLRRHLLLVAVVYLSGCQTQKASPPAAAGRADGAEAPAIEAVTASALVFDPPVAQNEPELNLARADRQARVAVGYEELTAEYFYIRVDDRQIIDGSRGWGGGGRGGGYGGIYDRYERRAVTERAGVRYR
jgi:hypothetical protein